MNFLKSEWLKAIRQAALFTHILIFHAETITLAAKCVKFLKMTRTMLNMLLTCVLKISPMLIMFKRKEISKCLQGNCAFQWHHHHPVVAIDSTETPANTSESEEGRGELAYYYLLLLFVLFTHDNLW